MMPIINGLMTALLLVLFIAVWIWAWSKRNKETFDSMARLPLQDEELSTEGKDHE